VSLIKYQLTNEFPICRHKVDLRISRNMISGVLPTELYSLSGLHFLHLQNCDFTGPLSPGFGEMGNLRNLVLDGNSFTGTIPEELGNLTETCKFKQSSLLLCQRRSSIALKLTFTLHSILQPFHFSALLYLHNNALNGTMPESVCSNREDGLIQLITDCYDTPAQVSCSSNCCTHCYSDLENTLFVV
jgi:hypothetical protein